MGDGWGLVHVACIEERRSAANVLVEKAQGNRRLKKLT
jgi:hypothetical protein